MPRRKIRNTRKRKLQKRHTRKRGLVGGEGNGNGNGNGNTIQSCPAYLNDEELKEMKRIDKLFKGYYEAFFTEADAKLDSTKRIEIRTEDSHLEEKELTDEEIATFKTMFSKVKLLEILKGHALHPIRPQESRFKVLKVFEKYNRLPRLPEDIRVWRTFKDVPSDAFENSGNGIFTIDKTVPYINRNNGNADPYNVPNRRGSKMEHSVSELGIASTSYNFESSIIFAQSSSERDTSMCLEFVIPKGVIALPMNGEVLGTNEEGNTLGGLGDESEIVIPIPFKLVLNEIRCMYSYKQYYYKDYIPVYTCTFSLL
jgi:hypothetical protein